MHITERYKKYLKSPQWQAKRQQVFKYYGRRCYFCRKYNKVLQVHHWTYKHLYNEPMADLKPICIPCHQRVTKFHRKNRRAGIERNSAYMLKLIRAENQ